MQFQSAPDCIQKEMQTHHPDMVIGECIDFIGDAEVHRPGKRDFGKRLQGYGGGGSGDYGSMPNTTMFPLLNACDFRMYGGGNTVKLVNSVHDWNSTTVRKSGQLKRYTGYHFHNFFASATEIRHKYKTYGHAVKNAFDIPLGKIHPDIALAVNCVMNRSDYGADRMRQVVGNLQHRVVGGLSQIVGTKPLYFDDAYNTKRYEELRKMIQDDEEQHRKHQSSNKITPAE
jgi:hypothetical protein